jgi:sialic acid synthase SpsE
MTSRIAQAIASYASTSPPAGPPLIIAEAGVNHEGSIDTALRMVDAARDAGAEAIKFQSYKATTLAVSDSPAYWDTSKETTPTQRELFAKYDSFGPAEFERLKRHSDDVGIEFMSTPFDVESATYLRPLVEVFKVASADITNHPFLRLIASFEKPILLSTGASSIAEVAAALDVIGSRPRVGLMHCVLNYPTERYDANLGMIQDLRARFPEAIPGYSDHTVPDAELTVLITAALLGARVIETHFTLEKSLPGNDHYHALDGADLKRLTSRLDDAFRIVGEAHKRPLESETPARRFARRSLVSARPIPAGSVLTEEDLTWKRPATGISPADWQTVIGRRARIDIPEDTVIEWRALD